MTVHKRAACEVKEKSPLFIFTAPTYSGNVQLFNNLFNFAVSGADINIYTKMKDKHTNLLEFPFGKEATWSPVLLRIALILM